MFFFLLYTPFALSRVFFVCWCLSVVFFCGLFVHFLVLSLWFSWFLWFAPAFFSCFLWFVPAFCRVFLWFVPASFRVFFCVFAPAFSPVFSRVLFWCFLCGLHVPLWVAETFFETTDLLSLSLC